MQNQQQPYTLTLTLAEWTDIESALSTAVMRHRGRRVYSERLGDEDEANAEGHHEEANKILLAKIRKAIPDCDTRLGGRGR